MTVSDVPAGIRIRLDGLFGQLCSTTGLYARETFLSLYGCIARMVRDHRMPGFVLTRTLNDASFETLAHALDGFPELPLFRFNQPDFFPSDTGICDQTGFLLVLTDRLCATVFWSAATHPAFRLYDGGWTFHPGDCRTLAGQLIDRIGDPALAALLRETPVDRRYDDKLNLLVTSLVHGLENRNRELTVALEQLKILNKRNVDTERLAAIGQLSSVIAHEIRNPLGLIDLYAKLTEECLLRLELPKEASSADAQAEGPQKTDMKDRLLKNLSLIRQATGSLETILSELTDYSRPLRLNRQSVDLAALTRDVCEFFRPSFRKKGVTLNVPELEADSSLSLSLDSEKIRQAIINLLKNALEASPENTTVTVGLLCEAEDPQITMTVTDEGAGMDAANVRKLFTPYFSTKGNGTGLGLAHSRKILQAHGGNVELLSTVPGKGSVFAIVLPRHIPEEEGFA